jgi:hypothetical protein
MPPAKPHGIGASILFGIADAVPNEIESIKK